MNIQQYMHMKQELATAVTFMQALAAEVDRLKDEIHLLKQQQQHHPRPIGRPPKEQIHALG